MHAGHTERAGYCALYIVNYLLQVRWKERNSLHFLDFSRLIISSLDGGDVFAVFYTEGIARQCSLSDRVSSEASKKNFLLLLLLSSNISSPN